MSNDVELLVSMYQTVQSGHPERAMDVIAPDIHWEVQGTLVLPDASKSVYRGHEGVIEYWTAWLQAWETLEFTRVEPTERDGVVLVEVEQRNRGRASGIEVDFHYFQAFRLRGGLVEAHCAADTAEHALAMMARVPAGSTANLAIVREMFDAWGRRDAEAVYRHYDPEIVWDARAQGGAMGLEVGHEAVREYWRTWLEAWETVEVVGDPEFLENGNQVASLWHQRMRGEASGVEIKASTGIVWTFQNGVVVHAALFKTHEEARAAIGLA